MASLNYQHLYYFWVIAREGGLAKAAASLRLTHSTLSVQLRALEDVLGEPLFERRGRSLVLTAFGREVQQYAGEIFRLGGELLDFAKGRSPARQRFEVGVVATIPKTMACRLLLPALDAEEAGAVRVRQGSLDQLLHELAGGRLHAVICDTVPSRAAPPVLHAHALGSSEIALYGVPELAARHRRRFPASLEGAPVVLPGPDTVLRRSLDRWFARHGLRVDVVGEVDDAGVLRALGAAGRGIFPVRLALRNEVEDAIGAQRVGRVDGVVESYFAVSLERRVTHPAVAALIAFARGRLDEPAATSTR